MVHRVNDLFNAKEIEQALDLVDDDLDMDWTNSIGPLKGVYRGREGLSSSGNPSWTHGSPCAGTRKRSSRSTSLGSLL